MEVLKTKLKISTNLENDFSTEPTESIMENKFVPFLDAMLNILNNYDPQVIHVCETVRFINFCINVCNKYII